MARKKKHRKSCHVKARVSAASCRGHKGLVQTGKRKGLCRLYHHVTTAPKCSFSK